LIPHVFIAWPQSHGGCVARTTRGSPPSLQDRSTQEVRSFELTVSVLAGHKHLAIGDPSSLIRSTESDRSAVTSVQAPRLSNRNQHHSRNGDVPVSSASSAARPMPYLWHSGSSARLNEHKLATSRETEHWLHPVLLHETSRFPYVFRPFTRVQLPMPQVFGVAAPLSRRL